MKARAALLTAAGLLLAGCGIPTTGVVEAGEPAVGVHQDVTLYFVRAQDGALVTVQRRAEGALDTDVVLAMLLKGVGTMEQKMLGLTTDLPRPTAAPTVRTHDGTVTVDLRTPAAGLTRTAVDQVVCTVLANRGATATGAGSPKVTVTAEGVAMPGPGGDDPCAASAGTWPAKPSSNAPTQPPAR